MDACAARSGRITGTVRKCLFTVLLIDARVHGGFVQHHTSAC